MTTAAADYRKLAKRYRTLPEEMVRAGAAELRKTTLTTLKRDVGSDRALSGTGRRGRRPSPDERDGEGGGTGHGRRSRTFTPARRQAGLWAIIESGTVKGSPAKFTFTQGVAAGVNMAERAMADEWEKANR